MQYILRFKPKSLLLSKKISLWSLINSTPSCYWSGTRLTGQYIQLTIFTSKSTKRLHQDLCSCATKNISIPNEGNKVPVLNIMGRHQALLLSTRLDGTV